MGFSPKANKPNQEVTSAYHEAVIEAILTPVIQRVDDETESQRKHAPYEIRRTRVDALLEQHKLRDSIVILAWFIVCVIGAYSTGKDVFNLEVIATQSELVYTLMLLFFSLTTTGACSTLLSRTFRESYYHRKVKSDNLEEAVAEQEGAFRADALKYVTPAELIVLHQIYNDGLADPLQTDQTIIEAVAEILEANQNRLRELGLKFSTNVVEVLDDTLYYNE